MTDLEGPTESPVEIFSCKGTPTEKYSSGGHRLGDGPGPTQGHVLMRRWALPPPIMIAAKWSPPTAVWTSLWHIVVSVKYN